MKTPVAYVRRSSASANNPGEISHADQMAAVRELAHRHGFNGDLVVYDDWGKSADVAKESKRTEFNRMLQAVERGEVSHIFAAKVDRLYRSGKTFYRLIEAAKRNGVHVETKQEGVMGGDGSPMAQAFSAITAIFAELELNTIKARVAGGFEMRRERGDTFGQPPYGYRHGRGEDGRIIFERDPDVPLETVLDAYREAGSVLGACRILEDRGVPAPKGGQRWATSALSRVIDREAPEMRPRRSAGGRRRAASAPLAHLVVCPFCGVRMTPSPTRGQLYCRNGARDRDVHPRYSVQQRPIIDFLKAESALLALPPVEVVMEGMEERREAITDRLERFTELYGEGAIDKAKLAAERKRATADMDRLEGEAAIVNVPPKIDWDWPPAELNAVLRVLWREVTLDERMQPVEAVWTRPEWRG